MVAAQLASNLTTVQAGQLAIDEKYGGSSAVAATSATTLICYHAVLKKTFLYNFYRKRNLTEIGAKELQHSE